MTAFSFALYDAFSASIFGGSQAAIINDARTIRTDQRQAIAREIGMPATAFVDAIGDNWVEVQYMSTVMELPMCGHGTICLLTYLLETDCLSLDRETTRDVELHLRNTNATVTLSRRDDGRFVVMLDITPPKFEPPPRDFDELLPLLGLDAGALDADLPLEIARGDFSHLVVPLDGLSATGKIRPDFDRIAEFCNANRIQTIAVFCREVEDPSCTIHVRDFCPAVGVSESAAAGTTNAALSSYLVRHGLIRGKSGIVSLTAEQGLELGRPSSIQSIITLENNAITRLQVGGVATKVLQGQVYL